MGLEYYILFALLFLIALIVAFIFVKKKRRKKRLINDKIKNEELVAAITAAVSVYTELPTSRFRVVSFKKINKFRAWNQH